MDRWKIISVLILALALIAGLDGQVQAEERIHDYHSDIQILNDGSLRVTETITVNAEGQKIKRGNLS